MKQDEIAIVKNQGAYWVDLKSKSDFCVSYSFLHSPVSFPDYTLVLMGLISHLDCSESYKTEYKLKIDISTQFDLYQRETLGRIVRRHNQVVISMGLVDGIDSSSSKAKELERVLEEIEKSRGED